LHNLIDTVKRTIWLKGYQNGNHIEPSEQRLQEIQCLFLAAIVLTSLLYVVAVLVTLMPDTCFFF